MILKKIFLIIVVSSSIAEVSAKELNVLMIGNSFSVCVGRYLPQIVADDHYGRCSTDFPRKNSGEIPKN